ASYVDAEWSSGLSPDVKGFVHGYLRTADNPYEMVQIRAMQGCGRSDVFGAALVAAADRDDARVQLLDVFLGRAAAPEPDELERGLERLYDEAREGEEEEGSFEQNTFLEDTAEDAAAAGSSSKVRTMSSALRPLFDEAVHALNTRGEQRHVLGVRCEGDQVSGIKALCNPEDADKDAKKKR
ncbi:unnamed protein product, partial [Symbiodinium sp. KB8]